MTPGTEHLLVIIALVGGACGVLYGAWKFLFNSSYDAKAKPLESSIADLSGNVRSQTEVLARINLQYTELDAKVDGHSELLTRHDEQLKSLEKESQH